MQRADDPPVIAPDAASPRPSNNPISAALLAGLACMPLVIATGFLVDRPSDRETAAVPVDISVLALRGQFDAAPDRRPSLPARAGY